MVFATSRNDVSNNHDTKIEHLLMSDIVLNPVSDFFHNEGIGSIVPFFSGGETEVLRH